jgi:hypothetical protein
MPETVVGLFKTRSEAEKGVRALERAGFGAGEIGLVWPGDVREGHYGSKVAAGVGAGTVVGGVLGALAAGLIPGLGPVIAGGALAAVLGGAAGATTGGLAGALVSMAATGDRALYYEQEVQSGRFLVSVSSERPDEAHALLRDSGALEASPIQAPIQELP